MRRISLLWEQSIAKATASHQREDEAWLVLVKAVVQEREQMWVAARAQHAYLALQIIKLVRPRLGALHCTWQVAELLGHSRRGQRGQLVGNKNAAEAAASDEFRVTEAGCCGIQFVELKRDGALRWLCRQGSGLLG